MTYSDFGALIQQAYRLYLDQDYTGALRLLDGARDRFPDQAAQLYFWRACMAALTGQAALAIRLLQDAVEAGHWYSERVLRQDPDLKSLQGLPEFERIAAICRKRQAEAQAHSRPELTVLEPGDAPQPWPLLMALHGNNSNVAASADYWRAAAASGWLLALPQSSQVGGSDGYVWDDRDLAVRELQAHFGAICQAHRMDPDRVVLAGFSLGAETAMHLALTGAIPARGFVAVCPGGPFMRDPDQWAALLETVSPPDVRGVIIAGEQDVPYHAGAMRLHELLQEHGIACVLESHADLGHAFPSGFEQSLHQALAFVLQTDPGKSTT